MERKAVSGIMLTLLLISMLTLALDNQTVKADGTIYIRPDGSVDPPTAPIQRDGNVYTFIDNIYDEIVVEKDDIVIDGADYTLQGSGSGTGFWLYDINGVTIQKTKIQGFSYGIGLGRSSYNSLSLNNIVNCTLMGIQIWSSSYNLISNNIITNNKYGIQFIDSQSNTISENIVANNSIQGVWLDSSFYNTLAGNNLIDNGWGESGFLEALSGVRLSYSSRNTLRNNSIAGNRYNFIVSGRELSHFVQDVDNSNTVDGKPIYYLVSRRNTEVPSNAGYVALVNSYNITVKNLELKNNYQGIILANTTNSDVANNNITNNYDGLYLWNSSYNTLSGNSLTNNSKGISLWNSPHNILSENSLSNNDLGIELSSSSNNVLRNNIMVNNSYSFSVSGSVFLDYFQDIDTSNTIDGKPIYYWINRQNEEVSPNAGLVTLINCTNITVKNLTLDAPMRLFFTKNSTIALNTITNYAEGGVWLSNSSSNNIYGNNITGGWFGIYLDSSPYNSIYKNTISGIQEVGGITLSGSSYNTIYSNTITNSYGIWLSYSSNNLIIQNNLSAIPFWQAALVIGSSSNNMIYHNSFVMNRDQISIYDSVNVWDDGYPSGGNFWSNYTGVDNFSGPYQNETGSDSIGDTPYIIDANNTDRYPLMNPWTPTPDFSISAFPTSLIIQQGSSDTSVITITSMNNFNQPVQLTVSGAPSGVTAALNPEQVTPPPDGSTTSTLTVSVDTTATPGSYTLTVTGTNGALTHSVNISLEITTLPPPADITPPTTPVVTDDGEYISSTTSLHATWSSSDPESGIVEYQYAIGNSPGGTDVVDWTSAGTATEVTHTGLNLIIGGTYYLSVKAKNGQGLWSEVGTSDGITVTTITFDLSPGWGTKELFVPIFYRSREEPGTMVLGVHNRRDMWYLVEVYRRQPNQAWERIHPWDLPYLSPYGQKTFRYAPKAGEEIKFVVWNDLNDETLSALWTLDFAVRALFGISISPQVTESEEFLVTLATFYNELLSVVSYLGTGQWKKAVLELGKKLATNTKAQQALVSLLKLAGIKVTIATIISKVLLLSFNYMVNAIVWWPLWRNTNKEPFMEDVIFTARYKALPAVPDVKVTKSLTILQREPYYVGQTIDAQLTIINRGSAPITFNVLTVGGRGPKGDADVRDFTFKTDITLNPGESYNYKGELKLLDSGSYHFFIAYQTSDGRWETSVPTEAGTTNTVDIFVDPIPEGWVVAELGSPAELRVYDSQGRVTGLVNGEEKNEIPHSTYYENIVVILGHADSYKYEVVGAGEGSYGLAVSNNTEQETATFNATDIPTSANAIHQYTIDWIALSQGEEGVTVKVDSDGDGTFEKTFTEDSEITRDEFMLQVPSAEAFPMWILGVAVATIAIAAVAIAFFWRRRKQPPIKG